MVGPLTRTTAMLLVLTGGSVLTGVGVTIPPAAAQAIEGERPSGVEVTRVTLSTGGLAEVEGAMDEADGAMTLSIERPQIADVLRTLVVTGPAPVVSIDLEAAEPVGERSTVGRLLAGDLSDPSAVLGSLIGERVELTGGTTRIAGTLLAFEEVRIPAGGDGDDDADGDARPGLRVAVATPEGRIAYATFPTLDALAIEGEAAAERARGLVPVVGRTVDDGRRELTVRLGGEARAGFSFVVPTTVWRPSYRALLDADGSARLQGWATLENTTGLDWNGIELRLAVGTPVAYRQDVYSPLRTSRPTAPFEVGRTARVDVAPNEPAPRRRAVESFAESAAIAMEPAGVLADAGVQAAPEPSALQLGGPVEAGTATSVFPVAGRIDLAAGRTLSVPFLDATEAVDRIAYLDLAPAEARRRESGARGVRALDALEVAFADEATVPGGLVAVFDPRGFAGDARFAGADGGETAILPFALSASVDATVLEDRSRTLISASLADGALIVRRELRTVTALAMRSEDAVTLVADGPRDQGAELAVEEADGVRASVAPLSADRYRMSAELPEGASELTLVQTRTLSERYLAGDLPAPVLEEVLSLGDGLDASTRAALEAIAAAGALIADLDRRIAVAEAQVEDLRRATAIDRENLEAIDLRTPEGAQVRQRIVERSNQLDALLGALRELRDQRLQAETGLRDAL